MIEIIEAELPLTDELLIEDFLDFMEVFNPIFYSLEEIPPRKARYQYLTTKSTTSRSIYYLARKEEMLVAQGYLSINTVNEERKNICYATVHVLPEYQHQGIGQQLVRIMVDKARELGIITYRGRIIEVFGSNEAEVKYTLSWIEKCGGHLVDSSNIVRLLASDLDVDALQQQFVALSQKFPTVELQLISMKKYYERLLNDDDYAALAVDYFNEATSLVPRGASSRKPVVDTVETAREKAKNIENNNWNNLTYMAWNRETKQYIGSSQVYYPVREKLTQVFTGLTAVRKAYWGRGLGKYLKLAMLQHLHSLGFDYLDTDNADTNERMLAINYKLGFRKVGMYHHVEGKFEDLLGK